VRRRASFLLFLRISTMFCSQHGTGECRDPSCAFFFFFSSCPRKNDGEISTSDLCFTRHGLQPIELLLEDL
jgi:hypothetical protein